MSEHRSLGLSPFYVTVRAVTPAVPGEFLVCVPSMESGPFIRNHDRGYSLALPSEEPSTEKGRAALRRTIYYAILSCLSEVRARYMCTDCVGLCGHAAVLAGKRAGLPVVIILNSVEEAERWREAIKQLALLISPEKIHFVVPESEDLERLRWLDNLYPVRREPEQRHEFKIKDSAADCLFVPFPPRLVTRAYIEMENLFVGPLDAAQYERLRILRNETAARSGFLDDRILDRAESTHYLAHRSNNPVAPILGIFDCGGEIVGSVGWHQHYSLPGVVEFTSLLLNHRLTSREGKVYADSTALFAAVIELVRDTIGARIAIGRVFADNRLCLGLCRRLGFRITGQSMAVQRSGRIRPLLFLRRDID